MKQDPVTKQYIAQVLPANTIEKLLYQGFSGEVPQVLQLCAHESCTIACTGVDPAWSGAISGAYLSRVRDSQGLTRYSVLFAFQLFQSFMSPWLPEHSKGVLGPWGR
jgi:hypothetical protein